MRDLKFKAWHTGRKQMFWFDVMRGNHDRGDGYIGMVEWGKEYADEHRYRGNVMLVDPTDCELMQYTGLKDKNGKEIYEGDLAAWYINGMKKIAPVYYDELAACFWMGKELETNSLILNDWMRGEYEIIGNIYENPEFLKS